MPPPPVAGRSQIAPKSSIIMHIKRRKRGNRKKARFEGTLSRGLAKHTGTPGNLEGFPRCVVAMEVSFSYDDETAHSQFSRTAGATVNRPREEIISAVLDYPRKVCLPVFWVWFHFKNNGAILAGIRSIRTRRVEHPA
jgi:hypothetical protein